MAFDPDNGAAPGGVLHRAMSDAPKTWDPIRALCEVERPGSATTSDRRVTCRACISRMRPAGERGSQAGG